MSQRRWFPSLTYNWISVAGAGLAAFSFGIFLFLMLIDLLVGESSLYIGLVTFCILPIFLVVGLLLIVAGMLRERYRRQRGRTSVFPTEFHLDLHDTRHLNATALFLGGTFLLVLCTSLGSYKLYQKTESVEFCGQLCHSVMRPEYIAYLDSPHAQVDCVACHIGSGADHFVDAKLNGAFQVFSLLTNTYETPIPPPLERLRPARETCEHCHWPQQFFGSRKDLNPHFLSDEANTPYPIEILLKIGGGNPGKGRVEGIHWHMAVANQTEYIARDKERREIAWVRITDSQGQVQVYQDPDHLLSESEINAAEPRLMDCLDCHNRPSHNYRSPNRAVNEALALDQIAADLPYIKREAVKVLDHEYPDTSTALSTIEETLKGFYRSTYPDIFSTRSASLDSAVAQLQTIYQRNFFPEMKVTWRKYPNHIGHTEFLGCFRCHGSALETDKGQKISADCNVCHSILSQGSDPGPGSIVPNGMPFKHPVDIGDAARTQLCTDCHEGGAAIKDISIEDGGGHQIHFASQEPALEDVQCIDCHVASFEGAVAQQTCSQANCHQGMPFALGAMDARAVHCVACHDFSSPLDKPTHTDVVQSPESQREDCLGCHTQEATHAQLPGNGIHSLECSVCHNPHQPFQFETAAVHTCTDGGCHAQVDTLSNLHHQQLAVAQMDCQQCHKAHDFTIREADCLSCHQDIYQRSRRAHEPTPRDETTSNQATVDLHTPSIASFFFLTKAHAEPHNAPATTPFYHDEHQPLACQTCHQIDRPIAAMDQAWCQDCHHNSSGVETCVDCHAPGGLNSNTFRLPQSLALSVQPTETRRVLPFRHEPHQGLECTECHSGGPDYSAKATDCTSCHQAHHQVETRCRDCHPSAAVGAHSLQVHATCSGSSCHTSIPFADMPRSREACLGCHQDLVAHKTPRVCIDCHPMPPGQPDFQDIKSSSGPKMGGG